MRISVLLAVAALSGLSVPVLAQSLTPFGKKEDGSHVRGFKFALPDGRNVSVTCERLRALGSQQSTNNIVDTFRAMTQGETSAPGNRFKPADVSANVAAALKAC
jgi:hypothetical protein